VVVCFLIELVDQGDVLFVRFVPSGTVAAVLLEVLAGTLAWA